MNLLDLNDIFTILLSTSIFNISYISLLEIVELARSKTISKTYGTLNFVYKGKREENV